MFGVRLRSMVLLGLVVSAASRVIELDQHQDGATTVGLGGAAFAAAVLLVRVRRIAFKLKILFAALLLAVPLAAAMFFVTSSATK